MRTDGAAAQAAARRHYVSLERGPDPAGEVLGIGPPAYAEGLKYASGGEPDREDEGPHSRHATDRSTDREQDSSCERPSRLVDYQGHEAQNDDILDERRKQRMRRWRRPEPAQDRCARPNRVRRRRECPRDDGAECDDERSLTVEQQQGQQRHRDRADDRVKSVPYQRGGRKALGCELEQIKAAEHDHDCERV